MGEEKRTRKPFVAPIAVTLEEDYEPLPIGSGRTAEPNMFDEHVELLKATWDSKLNRTKGAIRIAFMLGESERTQIKFRQAARNQGYTARFDDVAADENDRRAAWGDDETFDQLTDEQKDALEVGAMKAYLVPLIVRNVNPRGKGQKGLTVSLVKPEENSEVSEDSQPTEGAEAVTA